LSKDEGGRLQARNLEDLTALQEMLYSQDRHALLVILQAMDAAGKDSTIKHVMSGVNPQGVQISSFKAPSAHELDHDYLWRSVVALPERGMIGIHNRSYYEEVLIARVHPAILDRQQLPAQARKGDIWRRRYEQINQFERYLVENGTAVVKIFLHVSKKEQAKRLLDRIETPGKEWKFSLQDVRERERWDDYQRAYEQAISATSTTEAPWYIVPADHKWFLHLTVGRIIVQTLKDLKLDWPVVTDQQKRDLAEGRRLLNARDTGRHTRASKAVRHRR
jgi:PPK2 family polyphosphate:nucleotide phosphotransferase